MNAAPFSHFDFALTHFAPCEQNIANRRKPDIFKVNRPRLTCPRQLFGGGAEPTTLPITNRNASLVFTGTSQINRILIYKNLNRLANLGCIFGYNDSRISNGVGYELVKTHRIELFGIGLADGRCGLACEH
jgi:hypothetical protein